MIQFLWLKVSVCLSKICVSLYFCKIKKTANSIYTWQLENSDSRMIPCSEKSEDQDYKMSSPSPESTCKQPMKDLSPGIDEMVKRRYIETPINFSDGPMDSDPPRSKMTIQRSIERPINFSDEPMDSDPPIIKVTIDSSDEPMDSDLLGCKRRLKSLNSPINF